MKKFLVAIIFAIAYLVAFELTYQSGPNANLASFFWLGLVFGALAICTFFWAGSRHILLASVFSYGQLLFIAAPAILIGIGQSELRPYLRPSAALLFLSLCFAVQMMLFMLSRSVPVSKAETLEINGSFQMLALLLIALSIVASTLGDSSSLSADFGSLALAAIILSSLVTFAQRIFGRFVFHATCLIVITSLYSVYLFDGFGRLVLASYLLTIGLVYSWLFRTYLVKVAAIVATVPGLIVLSLSRIAFVAESQGRDIGIEDGMGSAFGPVQSGMYIFQQAIDGEISPTQGESLFASLFFWIPRSVWSEKPVGFGRAIVPVTKPELASSSVYSDAAPYMSEFVWDFGILGLLLAPVLIYMIVMFDRWIEVRLFAMGRSGSEKYNVFLYAFVAVFVGMILNYVWGGSFPYLVRTMLPALALLSLYHFSKSRNPKRGGTRHTQTSLQAYGGSLESSSEQWKATAVRVEHR